MFDIPMESEVTEDRPISSPCVNICTLDPRRNLCLGCFRTIDEIAHWPSADDGWKRAVLARLDQRRRAESNEG